MAIIGFGLLGGHNVGDVYLHRGHRHAFTLPKLRLLESAVLTEDGQHLKCFLRV